VLAEVRRVAVPLDQLGLVVEQVDVTGPAGHEQLHDALRLRRVVRPGGERPVAAEEGGEGDASEPPPECHRNRGE